MPQITRKDLGRLVPYGVVCLTITVSVSINVLTLYGSSSLRGEGPQRVLDAAVVVNKNGYNATDDEVLFEMFNGWHNVSVFEFLVLKNIVLAAKSTSRYSWWEIDEKKHLIYDPSGLWMYFAVADDYSTTPPFLRILHRRDRTWVGAELSDKNYQHICDIFEKRLII